MATALAPRARWPASRSPRPSPPAAASGRRAATRSAVARTKPKIAQRTSECISGFASARTAGRRHRSRRHRSQRPAGPGRAHARHGTAAAPTAGRRTRTTRQPASRRDTRRADVAGRNERGQQREGRDDDTVSHLRSSLEAQPRRRDRRSRAEPRREASYARATASSARAESTAPRSSSRRTRRSGCRVPPAGGGPARHGSAAPRSSRRRSRRRRRAVAWRARGSARSTAGSVVAVTTASSPLVSQAWSPPRNRASPSSASGSAAASCPIAPSRSPAADRTGTTARERPVETSVARRPRVACACTSEPATRTATSKLDSGGSADRAPGIAVEDHDDAVVRGVLELLDHQLAAPRAGRPVHAAQRLALLVL